jgi:phage/plasmid-associated DNA primase
MIYAANEAPEIKEDTKAVWRRLLPISCTTDFSGEKDNPNILNELTTPDQLSAFLKYALEGLQRLIKNNKFTSDKGEEENRAEYIRKSNSTKAWIEERLEYINDTSAWIEADELYKQYITFCQKEKLPSNGKAQLTQALNQYLLEVNKKQRRVLGKLKWGWVNVRAKEDNPFEPTVTSVTTLHTVETLGLNNIERVVERVSCYT